MNTEKRPRRKRATKNLGIFPIKKAEIPAWRRAMKLSYARYKADIEIVIKLRAEWNRKVAKVIKIRKRSRPHVRAEHSILVPKWIWDDETLKILAKHLGKSLRWIHRQGIPVRAARGWKHDHHCHAALTMLAEENGFWKSYPSPPRLILVYSKDAKGFIRHCQTRNLDGRSVRWIRTARQLSWYIPEQVDRVDILQDWKDGPDVKAILAFSAEVALCKRVEIQRRRA